MKTSLALDMHMKECGEHRLIEAQDRQSLILAIRDATQTAAQAGDLAQKGSTDSIRAVNRLLVAVIGSIATGACVIGLEVLKNHGLL